MDMTIWSNDMALYDFEATRQIVADEECIGASSVTDDAVYRHINDDICLSLDAEEEFLESVRSGAAKLEDVNRFTASLGPRVEPIYGWRRDVK